MKMNLAGSSRLAVATMSVAMLWAAPALASEVVGSVADSTRTRALQAAEVTLVELNRTTTTARDGSFRFGDVPAGTYTLRTSYIGAPVVTQQLVVPETGVVTAAVLVGGVDSSEIIVVGQTANQASALNRQRAADGVVSALTRDAIGQFPDQNVAESLRRLSGVNVLNDQGEGRFVSVRGLDPELNATSINGVRLPAPESDVRSVALDVISSDTVESIEVKKSLTPDMDADTIGASIEIHQTSAFDRKKDLYAARVEGSYNAYDGSVTPKAGFDFATRITDNFGIAGGVSYYRRKFQTDNIEASGWATSEDGTDFVEELEYRDYDVERKRLSTSLSLDYRAGENTTLYARGQYSQFDDQEYRQRLAFVLDADEGPSDGDADSATFSDKDARIEARRDLKDRFESQKIRSIVLGAKTDTGVWKIDYSGSWAKSSEREDDSLDPTRFRARFEDDGVAVKFNYANNRVPLYAATSGAALFNDPTQYSFNRLELTDLSDSTDEEYAMNANIARMFVTGSGTFTVQAGAKQRWRDKRYNMQGIYYGDFDGDYTLADVLGRQTYRIADIGPVPSHNGPTDFFFQNRDKFEIDPLESGNTSANGDYSVREDVSAGYLLGRWDSSTVRVIGGVRVEHTRNRITGNLTELVEEGATRDGEVLDEDMLFVSPLTFRRNYTDWLPSVTLRFAPKPDMVFRLAGSRSLVRPKLSKLAPRFMIEENDENEREGEFGNPDLKPYKAWNLDASAEYYLGSNGGISAGVFYKDIEDFIVDANFDAEDAPYNGVFRGVSFDEAIIPLNGDKAHVFGVELSYSQQLDFLPGLLSGLLFNANYTYTDAKGKLGDGREIPLPAASKNTFNLVLGYEKGPISLRAAGTYRSKYLDETGGDAEEDRYVDQHFQLDLSAKYRVMKSVRLFAEVVNLNDARYFAYQNFNNRQRLLQYERYGRTVKFGTRVDF